MRAAALSDREHVLVSGPDAVPFLQGQASCDMERLDGARSLTGALCNIKGRVVADFRAVARDGGCLLQCRRGVAEAVVATLSRYAVFSKATIAADAGPAAVFGVFGEGAGAALGALFRALPEADHGVAAAPSLELIRIPGAAPRFELWCHDEAAAARARGALAPAGRIEDEPAWDRQDMLAGIAHVDAGMSGNYTPQLLNYDLSGVIDFKKGCYTGQEVVARMHYRGKAKKRLHLLRCARPAPPDGVIVAPGDPERPAGEILRAHAGAEDEDPLLLAVLEVAAAKAGGLALAGDPPAPLEVLPLPYGGRDGVPETI